MVLVRLRWRGGGERLVSFSGRRWAECEPSRSANRACSSGRRSFLYNSSASPFQLPLALKKTSGMHRRSAVLDAPCRMDLRLYHLGSFPREAIRCLIYFNNYCCVGLKARCEKRGCSSRALLKSSFSSRNGQHLSWVCLTMRTVPFPSGSDLQIGS